MAFNHGVKTEEKSTALLAPIVASSGIPFVVGTAPVHLASGSVNEPVLANSYEEAVSKLGFSNDFTNYTLCESIYAHFVLFGMSPVIFVNVLDPATAKTDVPADDIAVTAGRIVLPFEAIPDSVIVKEAGGGSAYIKGADYEVIFDKQNVIIEIVKGGGIPGNAASLSVEFSRIEPTSITKDDIIGGFDPVTFKTTGLELIKNVFSMSSIVPDLIMAPGFSHHPEVATVMAAKATGISGIFCGKALIDAPAAAGTSHYSQLPQWKNDSSAISEDQLIFWPMAKLGDRIFHLSTLAAGLIASVDSKNSCPYESPSNKPIKAGGICLEDGTEVVLDLNEANFLNQNGIITALSISGFKLWGNMTAAYPTNTDTKDYFIPVSRMFDFIRNTLVLTTWIKVDNPMNKRLVSSITDTFNIWLNSLTADGKLLGGRVEFSPGENPDTDLIAGKIRYHVYVTPPGPAQSIEFIVEYDAAYLATLFA